MTSTPTDKTEGSTPSPGVDQLTGLASRETFAWAVQQADADRDRLAVAVLHLDGVAEVNLFCDFGAGDDLVRETARSLSVASSVNITVARIGGSQFGVLWTPIDERPPTTLVEPVIALAQEGVDRWLDHRIGLGLATPVVPQLLASVSIGFTAEVWTEAEVAVDYLRADERRPTLAVHDEHDLDLAAHRVRHQTIELVAEALRLDDLALSQRTIDRLADLPAGAPTSPARLLRLSLTHRRGEVLDQHRSALGLTPGLAGRLDRRLMQLVANEVLPNVDGDQIVVPLSGPLTGRRSALQFSDLATAASERAHPALEVDLHQLQAATSGARRRELGRCLDELGTGLVVTDFDGGWQSWLAVEHLPIRSVRPPAGLVQEAIAGQPGASRILAALVANAQAIGALVTAPSVEVDDDQLRALGFDQVERVGDSVRETGTMVDSPA